MEKIFKYIFSSILLGLLFWSSISSHIRRQEVLEMFNLMDEFHNINRIAITSNSIDVIYTDEYYRFERIRAALYPFRYESVRAMPPDRRRRLLSVPYERISEIKYYIDDEILFSVDVYVFNTNIFYNDDFLRIHLFEIDGQYGLALINNGNFMGRFDLEEEAVNIMLLRDISN